MCVLRLVKGSQEDARNISWKQQQKAEAVAPPVPPRPSKHEPIDPTTVGPRFRARTTKTPGYFGSHSRHPRTRRTTAQVTLPSGMKPDFPPQGAEVSTPESTTARLGSQSLGDIRRDTRIGREFALDVPTRRVPFFRCFST